MGHIPGPSPFCIWSAWRVSLLVRRRCEQSRWGLSLSLLVSRLPTQQTCVSTPTCQGNQPSFLPPNPGPGEGARWLFTQLMMKVLRPRPLSLLEESKAQASAPLGMGTQEIQGPAGVGVGI